MAKTTRIIVPTLAILVVVAQAAALAKTTTISYTTWLGDVTTEKKLIDRFMDENPDIKVKVSTANANPLFYVEKVLTSIIGGQAPDVMRINHECIVPLYNAKGLLNLNALIKQSKLDMKSFYEPNVKLFNFGGAQYGIPVSFNNGAVFYNRKNTQEAGIPELSTLARQKGWTRDAFLGIAKKLTRDTNGDGRNETWGVGDMPSWILDMYVKQAGGLWYSKDGKRSVFNSKETVDGLDYIFDLRNRSKVWNPNATWDSISSKKAATQIVSGWAIGMCVAAKLDFDVADVFTYKEDKFMEASGDGFGISSASKNRDAAWRLVKYLTGHQAVSYMTKQGDIAPTLISVAQGEHFAKAGTQPKNREAFLKSMDYSTVTEPRYVRNQKSINSAIDTIMNAFYAGRKSPAQTAAEVESAINRLIR